MVAYLSSLFASTGGMGASGGAWAGSGCNCDDCVAKRMPPSELVKQYDAWGRKMAADLTEKLRKLGCKGWVVKWVDWDDPSRVKGSAWGNNITDFRQQIFQDGQWLSCFVISAENFNPMGVYLSTKEIELVWRDPKTGDPVPLTLYELLKNAGKYFAHKGFPPNLDLTTGEDDRCFYREQFTIFMVKQGMDIKTRITGRNYQAGNKVARNLNLIANAQTVDAQFDDVPEGQFSTPYMMAEFDPKSGKMIEQYTMADAACKRTIAQSGTETKEEALQAIAEGKCAELKIGVKGSKKSSPIMCVQIPILQQALHKADHNPAALIAAAMAAPEPLPQGLPPSPAKPELKSDVLKVEVKPEPDPKSPAPKKPKKERPPSPVSMPWSEASVQSTATVKTEAPPPKPTPAPAASPALPNDVVVLPPPVTAEPDQDLTGMEEEEAAAAADDDGVISMGSEEDVAEQAEALVSLGAEDDDEAVDVYNRGLRNLADDEADALPTLRALADTDDADAKYRSLGAEEDDDAESEPEAAAPVFRSCGASALTSAAPALTSRSLSGLNKNATGGLPPRPAMAMNNMADALPEVEQPPETNLFMSRFYAGPAVGEQRKMLGHNPQRDPAGGLITVTKTFGTTCDPSKLATEEDVVQFIKLMLGNYQHAVDKCGGTAENLMSDFAEKLGHTTPSLSYPAAQGIAQTIKDFKAVTNKLPAGLFD